MKLSRKIASTLAVVGLVTNFAAHAQTRTGVSETEIVVGMFAPLSGSLAGLGTDALNAARSYFMDINEKGGVNGRKIRMIVEDDKCSPNETSAIVRKFINDDKVFLIVGGSCSGSTVSVQQMVNQERVPHFMLNASGDAGVYPPTKYQLGSSPGTQRATAAGVMEFTIKGLKAKSIAVLGPDDAMGSAALGMIKAMATKYGVKVVATESIPNGATDVTVPVINMRAANPDVIVMTTYPQPTYLVLKKLVEFGIDKPIVSAIQGVSSPEVLMGGLNGDKTALKNFYYAHPLAGEYVTDAVLKPWTDMIVKYNPGRPQPGIIAMYGFPHPMAIVAALQAIGRDVSREKFMDQIDKTNLNTGVMATPTVFTKDRRDSNRGQVIVKFDGDRVQRVGGPYLWDQLIDPATLPK
jgi:branched-chain amino acid transport system substrate-binding protein